MSRRGWVLFAAMSVIWGIPYLLIRIAVRDFSPATLVFVRTGAAGIFFVPLLVRRDVLRSLWDHWRPVVAYTVVEVAAPWLLLSTAEQRLTSSLSGLLIATVPLVAIILSWATRHEGRLGWSRLSGLVLGFAGVAVIVGVNVHGPDAIAVVEVLGTAVCYATGPFIIARNLAGISSSAVVGASLVLTAIGYAPIGLTHLPDHVTPEVVASLSILVAVCTGVAFLIYFALITEVGPARATVITYLNPAVAVVLGIAILHEHFSLGLALGVPLVLLGSFFGTGGMRPARADGTEPEHPALATGADPPPR
jgi:drug/metabolite transporter (DMT)-like permease